MKTTREDLIRLFNEVNDLDDTDDPLTSALVQEFREAAFDAYVGRFGAREVREASYAIIRDVVRFADALQARGMVTYGV